MSIVVEDKRIGYIEGRLQLPNGQALEFDLCTDTHNVDPGAVADMTRETVFSWLQRLKACGGTDNAA